MAAGQLEALSLKKGITNECSWVKDSYICICGERQTQRRAGEGKKQQDLFPGLVLILTFQLKILRKGTVQPQA